MRFEREVRRDGDDGCLDDRRGHHGGPDDRGGPTRRTVLAALTLLPLAVRAASDEIARDATVTMPLRRDADGRPLVRATIDGHGTCDLVVDTAATRTALLPDAVERLQLKIADGDGVRVHGTTGAARLRVARVPALRAGDARLDAADVPVLPRWSVPGADGLLGTDALAGCTLALDFTRGTMSISRAQRAPRAGALRATHRFEGAIAVSATVGDRSVPAIVDTGAARTLATPSLAALCLSEDAGRTERRSTVRGVDLGTVATRDCELPWIALGRHRVERPTIGTLASSAFEAWRLADRPALLLGMDVLGKLPGLRIDFAAGWVALDA